MIDPTALASPAVDAAVSWIAAAGCLPYLWYLQRAQAPAGGAPAKWLAVAMGLLLLMRGFSWLGIAPWLQRPILSLAATLPLLTTLFCEQLLRRHHPLPLKLSALGTSAAFLFASLFWLIDRQAGWLVTFACTFAAITAWNAWLMRRPDAELGVQERRLSRALMWVALLAVPLILSDFRTTLGLFPVRLGGLVVLLFIHAMLAAELGITSGLAWLSRLLLTLVSGALLAMMFAWLHGFAGDAFVLESLRGWPVTTAILLLAGVVVAARRMSASSAEHAFLQWFSTVPLEDSDALVQDLSRHPQLQGAIRLQLQDLAPYDLDALWKMAKAPVSLAEMEQVVESNDPTKLAAAEQWVDLLTRHGMNHALAIRRDPPLMLLMSLPSSSRESVAWLRLAIVQRIARRLAEIH